jgi:hypothetical protein
VTVRVFAHRCKEVIPLALSFVGFGIAILTVWFFLLKPWPGVTASDDWKLINEPASGTYSIGDLVAWEKSNVCVPAGETTVQIFFIQDLPNGLGELRRMAYTRVWLLQANDCRNPNFTSIMVPYDVLPGQYEILLRSCTNSPSPIDTCIETPGPVITVSERDTRIQRLDR